MRSAIRIACGLLLATGLLACGSEDPDPFVVGDWGGAKLDGGGIGWPELGSHQYDYSFKYDKGGSKQDGAAAGDGASMDGSSTGDGGGSCTGPAGAKCTGCPTSHICSGAKGGTCAKAVVLSGPASNKPVLKAVAVAYVECWNKSPSSDTLCATFDSCQMTGTLTDKMVKNWVCNAAQKSDFPSSAVYDKARDLVACNFYNIYRPDWKLSSITGGSKGVVCLSYDVDGNWLYQDFLHVNSCSAYPPK